MLNPTHNKQHAVIFLVIGCMLPLSIFLCLTWLSVKYDLHVIHSDGFFWVIYSLIALPLFWRGVGYWSKKPVARCLLTLGLLVICAVVIAISVLFFHVGMGGKL